MDASVKPEMVDTTVKTTVRVGGKAMVEIDSPGVFSLVDWHQATLESLLRLRVAIAYVALRFGGPDGGPMEE